jgi:hypothetical protein
MEVEDRNMIQATTIARAQDATAHSWNDAVARV